MTLSPEQLELRRQGIGGSEIGAVAGVSPYASALDVWARKLGLAPDDAGEAAEWGELLEPVIALAWAKRAGVGYYDLHQSATLRHKEHARVLATPDRIVRPRFDAPYLLEVKTAGLRQAHRWGPEGSDELPEEYICQATWQMAVVRSGAAHDGHRIERCVVACLLGGQELREYEVRWEPELAARLIELAEDFWERYVEPGEPPPAAGSDQAAAILGRHWPRATQPLLSLQAGPESELLEELLRARAAHQAAERRRDDLEAAVKALIGPAEGVEWSGGRVTWRATKDRSSVDWEAVARAAGATDALIAAHTSTKPGPRVLRVSPRKEE